MAYTRQMVGWIKVCLDDRGIKVMCLNENVPSMALVNSVGLLRYYKLVHHKDILVSFYQASHLAKMAIPAIKNIKGDKFVGGEK